MSGLLTLASAVVVVAALYVGRDVLVPITLAVLLSFILVPLVNVLRRIYFGRVLSVLVAVVVALSVVLALGGLIGTQIASLAAETPLYQATIERKISAIRAVTTDRLSQVVARLGRQVQQATKEHPPPAASEPAANGPAADTPAAPKPVPVEVHEATPSPIEMASRILEPAISPLATAAIVLIFAIFILLQREDLRDRMIRLFGSPDLHRTTLAMDDAARRLSRYFLAQLGINAAFGCVIAIGLYFIGVPSPMLWGSLSMLLRFVPYIGSPLSAIPPMVLAAAVYPNWSVLIWTAGLFAVVEPLTAQVVEPMLYGRSTGLSPFAVVVAATFWTWLWGPIGLLLSTPLTLCLVVLGRHVKRLEFLDVLLGDQPALSPAESFYQRMLAGDPDEALDQAEILLNGCTLTTYYDEVALAGLRFAGADAMRGELPGQQLERVKKALNALIADLARHDDAQPPKARAAEEDVLDASPVGSDTAPAVHAAGVVDDHADMPMPWGHDNAVLCVGGRGPLDDGVSAMLAQLLRKHGIGARALPFEALSRDNIGMLEVTGVEMVCVCYLEITGSPASLRYLLRRLRERLRGVPVLVGFWPPDDEALQEERVRAVIGADIYTSSLREAVEACLNAAHHVVDVPAPVMAA